MYTRLNADTGLLVLALLLAGCGKQSPEKLHFDLDLHAQSTTETPIAEVHFWVDGNEVGVTDDRGTARAVVAGREGQAVTLSTACPPAYRTLEPHRRLILRRVQVGHADGASGATARIGLVARCEPEERLTAVVVRTRGPYTFGLPIKVRGEVVGTTQPDGTAHLLVRARPNSSLRVQLDTQTRPELIPQSPMQIFQIGDEDSILLFEQSLALAHPPRQHSAKRHAAPWRVPYRIN